MRLRLLFIALLVSSQLFAQENHDIIIGEFERLKGIWDGYMEYTDETDNKTKFSMPAKCSTTFNGKKWEYAVQYDAGNGEMVGGKGECTVNKDGDKMNYDGVIWNVSSIEETGDTTIIIIETEGKENRQKALLRRTMIISSTTFSILEEVNFIEQNTGFIMRNKHLFRRKVN